MGFCPVDSGELREAETTHLLPMCIPIVEKFILAGWRVGTIKSDVILFTSVLTLNAHTDRAEAVSSSSYLKTQNRSHRPGLRSGEAHSTAIWVWVCGCVYRIVCLILF